MPAHTDDQDAIDRITAYMTAVDASPDHDGEIIAGPPTHDAPYLSGSDLRAALRTLQQAQQQQDAAIAIPARITHQMNATWTRNGYDCVIAYTGPDGQQHTWHARFNERANRDSRHFSLRGWWAWPDVRDDDAEHWDEPLWLDSRLTDAQDEFLLLIVHGWMRPFGFVGNDTKRPIYGKGKQRRERAFIIGELTGRGVCPTCHELKRITEAGVIRYHGPHNRPCPGSHHNPAPEPQLTAGGAR